MLVLFVGGAVAASENPRADADHTLQAVSAVPSHRTLAAEPIANAEAALKRADDARAAGDHDHAALLEALGLEWAETGRDLVRAAEAEAAAAELDRQTAAVEDRVARARALLEQTVARRGRARAQLAALQAAPSASAGPSTAAPPAARGGASGEAKP